MSANAKRLDCSGKSFFREDLSWTKCLFVFILYSLFLSSAGKAEEAGQAAAASYEGVEVEVRLSVDDAELSGEIARLRQERSRLEERALELERQCRSLENELESKRRELFESINIINGQNEKLNRWQQGLAGLYDVADVAEPVGREDRLNRMLDAVSESGLGLALDVAEFCREIDSSLNEWNLSQVQRAQIRLKLNSLTAKSRQFSALANRDDAPGALEKCRILAVNRDLEMVTLSVGSGNGAVNGLNYRVTGKEGVLLTIVAVRPFVAAAMVTAGDVRELAPGMEAVTEPKKNTEE